MVMGVAGFEKTGSIGLAAGNTMRNPSSVNGMPGEPMSASNPSCPSSHTYYDQATNHPRRVMIWGEERKLKNDSWHRCLDI
jgi:hypothetical protein